ncbi:MAG: YbaK/EbsC family protein [Bacteroidota bacterium]|nr:YbaK/EbsC family protein [Bacteroidota bacterium]MDP4193114.1 YbaK/EbsC family protein [Bacteroidota bacterium]MDP4195976.1 YbaK/EbsC family protein [Bacteroidota bacterium]
MTLLNVKDYLQKRDVRFKDIFHPVSFSAQETAARAHVKGREFAKTVLIFVDNKMVMTVLPASHFIDFDKLKTTLKAVKVGLASESEFKSRFPGCEVGAMPPFGNLFNMEVYMSESLLVNRDVTFNAGSHTEAITISIGEFVRIINPKILDFTRKHKV